MKKNILCLITVFQFIVNVSSQSKEIIDVSKKMLYPDIPKGKYDIGYKIITDFDYSRTYDLNYPKISKTKIKNARPIIVNIWYPATIKKDTKSMFYGDYIKLPKKDGVLNNFITRIEEYNESNSMLYMLDTLTKESKEKFKKHLNQPVNVFENAEPVNKKFPLVVYHPGLGGSLNDNTILCEYLASNGFVVISGAFQSIDYKFVDVDWDLERSTKDIDFMLNMVKHFSFIDFSKIAAVGHSYGAQAILGYKTEDFSPVSCLISLDNTIDYSDSENPEGFEPLTFKLNNKNENMNVPTLVFANPHAQFKVINTLNFSDRIYLTIPQTHNEFISIGAYAVLNDLQDRKDKDTVWKKYVTVNNYCLNFLKWNLYQDTIAKKLVFNKNVFIDELLDAPVGKFLPDYTDFSRFPTDLELKKLLMFKNKVKIDKIIEIFPENINESMINTLGYQFINNDIDFAFYFFEKNVQLFPNSWNVYDSLAEAYAKKGENAKAIEYYSKSIQLNPNNENGIFELERLKSK